jgi:UDP:flavonoid glycosyltransferase YjiC (YdhE family)
VAPNGFALPPAKLGFLPIYDPAVTPIHVEGEVFDAVREAQHRLALPPIASVFDLYRGDAAFVCVLPEFDPYAERREPRAVGPLHPLPPPNARPAAALFAYLSYAAPAFAAAVDALGGLEVPVRLFVRDATPALRAWLSGRGLIVDANPAPLHEVLAQAAAVLHEGGVGLAQAALAAGVPQVVVPTGAAGDANFNASVLLRMGSGIAADAASIPAALDRMLEPAQGLKAIAAAHLLVDRLPPASLPRVVESSLALAYR